MQATHRNTRNDSTWVSTAAVTTAAHRSTLQDTATHGTTRLECWRRRLPQQHITTHCNTLQHTARLDLSANSGSYHCNTPQHTARHRTTRHDSTRALTAAITAGKHTPTTASYHMCSSHVTCDRVTSRVNESYHMWRGVMPHICYTPHMNKSCHSRCHSKEWWLKINESCHTCARYVSYHDSSTLWFVIISRGCKSAFGRLDF